MAVALVGLLAAAIADENVTVALEMNVNPAGVGANPVGRPKSDIDMALARRLYVDECKSLGKTAAACGVATLTLRARFEEHGIPVRGRGRPVKAADRFEGGALTLDKAIAEAPEAVSTLEALIADEAAEIAAREAAEAETVEVREVTLSEPVKGEVALKAPTA